MNAPLLRLLDQWSEIPRAKTTRPFLNRKDQLRKHGVTSQAFTLPEVLVGILVIAIAVVASAALVSTATGQFRRGDRLYQLNQLVEDDISAIRTINDRMVCNTGACTIFAGDPTRNNYFPPRPAPGAAANSAAVLNRNFVWNPTDRDGLCQSTTVANGFGQQAINLIEANTTPSARLNRVLITNAAIDPNGQMYAVRYTSAELPQFTRTFLLTPSIFAWCPSDT